jgi:predicted O-methyltransferase YrrM
MQVQRMLRSITRKTLIPVAFGGVVILGNIIGNGTASAQTRGPRTIAQEMNHRSWYHGVAVDQ